MVFDPSLVPFPMVLRDIISSACEVPEECGFVLIGSPSTAPHSPSDPSPVQVEELVAEPIPEAPEAVSEPLAALGGIECQSPEKDSNLGFVPAPTPVIILAEEPEKQHAPEAVCDFVRFLNSLRPGTEVVIRVPAYS